MKPTWDKDKALQIINSKMLHQDAFSQWLGIKIEEINEHELVCSCLITESMTNGFNIAHGGVVFSLCDSVLAFLSNMFGRKAVSIETQISHLKMVYVGEKLITKGQFIQNGRSICRACVEARNENNDLVAYFKGTVYFTGEMW